MRLNDRLKWLKERGCYPCISYRGGGVWRAHVNGAGNFWEEASNPTDALESAVSNWKKKGKPVDGYAALSKVQQ